MSGAFSKESIKNCTYKKTCTGNIFVDEYIHIPDSLSGIKDILFLDVFPSIENSEILNSKLSIKGVLRYSIVYIAEDNLASTHVLRGTVTFSNAVEFSEKLTPNLKCDTYLSIDRADHSIVNSKKISLNAVVKVLSNILAFEEKSFISDAQKQEELEIFKNPYEYFAFAQAKDHEFTLSYKFEIPFDKAEISEILTVNISSYTSNYTSRNSQTVLQCLAKAKALYLSADGNLCIEEFEFSDDNIEGPNLEQLEEDAKILFSTRIKDIDSLVLEDSDGERRVIRIDIKFYSSFDIYNKKSFSFLKDIFYTQNETILKNVNYTLVRDIESIEKSFAVRGNFNDIGAFDEIFMNGAAITFDCFAEGSNTLIINGVIKLNSIVITNENCSTKGVKYFEIPFSESISFQNALDLSKDEFKIEISERDAFYGLLHDNRLEVEVKIDLCVNCLFKENITVIEEVSKGQPISSDEKDCTLIRLYYTCQSDTLWDVCKKFRLKKDALLRANEGIDFDTPEASKMLILP